MPTSNSDGSQTCTIDTEHTLATITTAGNFLLTLDCDALALGDTLWVRTKLKVRSTGTTRTLYQTALSNVQATPVAVTPPIASLNEIVFTIEQTDGTGRTIPWEIIEL